jgi:hypothetical protein
MAFTFGVQYAEFRNHYHYSRAQSCMLAIAMVCTNNAGKPGFTLDPITKSYPDFQLTDPCGARLVSHTHFKPGFECPWPF